VAAWWCAPQSKTKLAYTFDNQFATRGMTDETAVRESMGKILKVCSPRHV
jgi:hypothetical protein